MVLLKRYFNTEIGYENTEIGLCAYWMSLQQLGGYELGKDSKLYFVYKDIAIGGL